MHGKGSIVWLNDGVGNLWWWHDWEGAHDSVWIFFSDLGDEECSHTGSSSTTEWVSDLKTLEAIASFCFFSYDIENWINKFSTLGVMSFGPVVTSTGLTEDEVVWSEELTEWAGSDGVHGSWFEIHKHCSWYISSTGGFIVIDVNSFKLKVRISVICSGGIDSVLVWDDLPEFGTDLVTALTCLYVYDFSHLW